MPLPSEALTHTLRWTLLFPWVPCSYKSSNLSLYLKSLDRLQLLFILDHGKILYYGKTMDPALAEWQSLHRMTLLLQTNSVKLCLLPHPLQRGARELLLPTHVQFSSVVSNLFKRLTSYLRDIALETWANTWSQDTGLCSNIVTEGQQIAESPSCGVMSELCQVPRSQVGGGCVWFRVSCKIMGQLACKRSLPWDKSMKLLLHKKLILTKTQAQFLPAVFIETTNRGYQATSQKAPLRRNSVANT